MRGNRNSGPLFQFLLTQSLFLLTRFCSPYTVAVLLRSFGQGVAVPDFGSSLRIHRPELMSGT